MNPKKISMGKKPERIIQDRLIKTLRGLGWFVRETHGNVYQNGFPDLFCCHIRYGSRWIEVKNSEKYAFTVAQLEAFPQFVASGSGIWVLCDDTPAELIKLMQPCNWYQYLPAWKGHVRGM